MVEFEEKWQIITVAAIALVLFVILFSIVGYLICSVQKLKKKLADEDDDESEDDESLPRPPIDVYSLQDQPREQHPPVYQNPYNPTETYQIRRAKLINSLRNKIEHNPREVPLSEINAAYENDYPHPNHGTLKNGILEARNKMSKKAPIPTPQEWHQQNRPLYPPNKLRQPYGPRSVDNYPIRRQDSRSERPRVLSRQESDVMAQYDQTIEGLNRPKSTFLHNRNRY